MYLVEICQFIEYTQKEFMSFKINKWLLLVILLSLLVRVLWLDKIPTGISNDELDYILNAKALFLTGSDISGNWNPLSFTTPKSSFPQAEIPPLLTFLAIGILPLSLFTSKLIYALFGTGIVVTLYFIAKKLLGEKEAIVIGLIAGFNPWLIYFGRTAYDTPVAVLGFLLGLYSLITFKRWKLLFAFPFFFIAFYSYLGTKLVYIPFLLITIFYSWYFVNKKKFTKQYISLFLLCMLPFTYFLFTTFASQGMRTTELSTPFISSIAQTTDYERKLSIQNPLTNVFSNKLVVFTKVSLEKYLNAFSPKFLFISGDDKGLFSVWTHGVFYYLDILFLLIGLCILFLRSKRVWVFIISLIFISPIPSALSNLGQSYAIRSQLLAPFLIFLVGFGIYSVFNSKFKYRKILLTILLVLYGFQFLNFANIYFFRNPIYNSEAFNFSSRVLSKYLSLQKDGETVIVNGTPTTPLKHYLFYTNALNKNTTDLLKEMYKTKEYKFNNINFVDCRNANVDASTLVIFESGFKCENVPSHKQYLTIPLLSDGGEVLRILNDKTCSKYKLNRYPYGFRISDFEIEKLSEKEFCEKFITNFF